MTGEANIETENWYRFPGNLPQTGFFAESPLTADTVTRKLIDLVKGYTTAIGYVNGEKVNPLGSGTFVKRADGQCGILTAGHVVGAIEGRERIVISQGVEDLAWIQIEAAGMEGRGKTNGGKTGPDIGWIPLSLKEVQELEAEHAVFYNRAKEREVFPAPFCRVGVVLGFVREASRPEDKHLGFHAIFTGKPRELPTDEDGWDYTEYGIDGDDPALPSTHGGVSGSASWRIDLPMDGEGRKTVALAGVVFAEGCKEDRKLIAHGAESVRMFLDGLGRAGGGRRQ